MNIDELLTGRTSILDVDIYLRAYVVLPNDAEIRYRRAMGFFEHFNVIHRAEENIVRVCDVCGAVLRRSLDVHRKVGYRCRCTNPNRTHFIGALKNTFLEQSMLNTMAEKVVFIIYGFLDKEPITRLMRKCGGSTSTGVAWYAYCREVARRIAWHDFQRIGGARDVVEVDETHLFLILKMQIMHISEVGIIQSTIMV